MSGLNSHGITRRPGSEYGSGCSSTASTTRKIAAFAPSPSASAMMESDANPGRRESERNAYFRLCKGVAVMISILYDQLQKNTEQHRPETTWRWFQLAARPPGVRARDGAFA